MKRVLGSIVCITLIVKLLCLAGQTAAQKDTLVIGIQDKPMSLDPAIAYDLTGWLILSNVYEGLVTEAMPPAPKLAESWDLSEDGRTWTFHLRKGVTFASGNPANADAVVFSLRRFVKIIGGPSWLLTQFGITEDSITKIDEETVQIVLDKQYAPSLFLSCLWFPAILDPEVVLAHEQNGDLGSAWLEDHSAGSGHYRIEARQRGTLTELKVNERYWGSKPTFERVIVKYIEEPSEQAVLLQAGEIDIARNLAVEDIEMLGSHPEMQIFQDLGLNIVYLTMSLGYAPFTSPEVRDAMRYAIDYDGIIDYVLGGAAVKHQSFIPKGFLGSTPATPYARDVDKARQLLTEGGYPEGFEVELMCLDYSPFLELAMKLQNDLAEIGVMVQIMPVNHDQLVETTYQHRDFQMNLTQWIHDYPDPDANAKAFAHCDNASDEATVTGPAWTARYVNLETSRLVEQAAQELDVETRRSLYEQINEMLVDDGPFVFLYTPIRHYAVRTEVVPFIRESEESDEFLNLK
jgi:peptide/nickel transport system substrate-binding protein